VNPPPGGQTELPIEEKRQPTVSSKPAEILPRLQNDDRHRLSRAKTRSFAVPWRAERVGHRLIGVFMLGYSFERIVFLLLLGGLFLGVVYLVASVLIHRYSGDRWPRG
jgi:hypothetical protein